MIPVLSSRSGKALLAGLVTLFVFKSRSVAQSAGSAGKALYIPAHVWHVPDSNNYNNNQSKYSYQRMAQSQNIAIFWAKSFGEDPLSNQDPAKRFDVNDLLQQCERFYQYYVDTLHMVNKGQSNTDRYKILMYVIDGDGGTAFGGGEEQKIGILWTPAARVNKAPYGALAHELGHSFQYLVHADGAWGFTTSPEGSHGNSIFEMTSQYMLWQVEPEWIKFENYHLVSYLKKTHYAFLHETNQYHSPYVLEYWSGKHGVDFIGRLWREAEKGEDPVMAYKRMTGLTQSSFNDEMFDAARRFITWDLPRVREVAAPYANQHRTQMDSLGNGWFRVAAENCPQNYGYNGIQLKAPSAGTHVKINFKGLNDAPGYRKINPDKAGWRYGLLAVTTTGESVYGKMYTEKQGTAEMKIPANTQYLWLVVSGAPTAHWQHLNDGSDANDEQWPYEIKLTGTTLVK